MKIHNGMRPQDIAVLLKIGSIGNRKWFFRDLSVVLHISPSEISESLNRSVIAGLLSFDKKNIMKETFIGFLDYGFKHVFPLVPGGSRTGIPTGISSSPLKGRDGIGMGKFVWPSSKGKSKGNSVKPLYKGAIETALEDTVMHELLALVDAVRLGTEKEKKLAIQEINNRIR